MGGQRLLVVPPELAYGSRGKPPLVPPNATVEFAVSLLSVRRSGTNPNSVINMVRGTEWWGPWLGLLNCVSGTVQAGGGEGYGWKTCERLPGQHARNTGEGPLVLAGTTFFLDDDLSPCLCAWTFDRAYRARPVFLCRERKCIDAPLVAGRLGSSVTRWALTCPCRPVACSFLWAPPSFYCFRAAVGYVAQCGTPFLNSTGTFWNTRHPGTLAHICPHQNRPQALDDV